MVSKDFNPQDFEDAEETLSLSDLPLHHSEDYSQEYESSSSDQFEFFSGDFTSNYYPTNDIIFCGKLIQVAEKKQSKEIMIQPRITHHAKKSRIFPWKSNSFSNSSEKIQRQKRYNTCKSFPVMSKSDDQRYDKRKRCRIPAKSRWNLFGIGVPGEMKLRDIKTRQNKRKPAAMFRYDDRKDEMVKNEERSRKLKRLWGLLRVFAFA